MDRLYTLTEAIIEKLKAQGADMAYCTASSGETEPSPSWTTFFSMPDGIAKSLLFREGFFLFSTKIKEEQIAPLVLLFIEISL